jgi:hypothetical protein
MFLSLFTLVGWGTYRYHQFMPEALISKKK